MTANGEEVHRQDITGATWESVDVDLSRYGEQKVDLELWNQAGGRYPWRNEHAYWDRVRILPDPGEPDSTAAAGDEKQKDGKTEPRKPKPPVSLKKTASRKETASPETIAAWDAKLLARVVEDIKGGGKPSFFLSAMGRRAKVLSADDEGLKISAGPMDIGMTWSRLSIGERKGLALAVARDNVPADQALVAFYLIASGERSEAEKHLDRAGDLADEVRPAFKPAP